VIGLIYGSFAVTAEQLISGTGNRRGDEESSQEWTATLLAQQALEYIEQARHYSGSARLFRTRG
jgi:hypothetical protein